MLPMNKQGYLDMICDGITHEEITTRKEAVELVLFWIITYEPTKNEILNLYCYVRTEELE